MKLLSLLVTAVFAMGSVISPIPDPAPGEVLSESVSKPTVSFADLTGTTTAAHNPIQSTPDNPLRKSFGTLDILTESVLGSTIGTEASVIAAPSSASPSGTRKRTMTIAILGDSMTDTLGPELPEIRQRLTAHYPGSTVTLLNYGVGGTNIEYGIRRISEGYEYLGQRNPALATRQPDVVVIESFAYNPIPDEPDQLTRHWMDLAKAVDTVRAAIPDARIAIAATIAPNSRIFCDGASGLSFSPEEKSSRTTLIKSLLDNTVRFARGEHLPLADAYHPSLVYGEGNTRYINAGDHIHYSPEGRAFFSGIIAETIIRDRLLE